MKKPVLPVSEKWVIPVQTTEKEASNHFVANIQCPLTNKDIRILGEFGNFHTIIFDGRIYIMPRQVIQWLLWSFDHKVDLQFSSEERIQLVGFNSQTDIETYLKNEHGILKRYLESNHITLKDSESFPECLDRDGDCPESIFFDLEH